MVKRKRQRNNTSSLVTGRFCHWFYCMCIFRSIVKDTQRRCFQRFSDTQSNNWARYGIQYILQCVEMGINGTEAVQGLPDSSGLSSDESSRQIRQRNAQIQCYSGNKCLLEVGISVWQKWNERRQTDLAPLGADWSKQPPGDSSFAPLNFEGTTSEALQNTSRIWPAKHTAKFSCLIPGLPSHFDWNETL